jgi:low affinity Fe/Cu permease
VKVRSPKTKQAPARRRIEHRTSQLPIWSRALYKIEHYTFLPVVALAFTAAAVALVVAISIQDFPGHWVAAFEISVSSLTLIMVFAIQHTQGREQAATQRKLDELIRAMPGADESLMMLEEAPQHTMLKIEDEQRDVRLNSTDTDHEEM